MNNKNFIRKKLRLNDYNYSLEGLYFITICIKNRIKRLGNIENNKIVLSKEGFIAQKMLKNIEKLYAGVQIDEYIIMPNHIHVIFTIKKQKDITISKILNQYKGTVTKQLGYSIWQKSFYDHIIRNTKEYYKIKEYIQNNIINWSQDEYFN